MRLIIAVSCLLTISGPAAAAMLDADTCARLKSEQVQLEDRGVRTQIAAGPALAARLSPQQLTDVRRLIEIDEQVGFRCPLPPPPKPPAAAKATTDASRPADDKAKPAPKAKPAAQAAGESAKDSAKAAPKPIAKPAAKPAAKSDDAYRPPAQ